MGVITKSASLSINVRIQVATSVIPLRLTTNQKTKSRDLWPLYRFWPIFSAWEEELSDDIDREFILGGIKNGFDIIDKDANSTPVHYDNHKSAQPGSPLYARATKQILHEIGMGNYEVVSHPLI